MKGLVQVLSAVVIFSLRRATALTGLPLAIAFLRAAGQMDAYLWSILASYWIINAGLIGLIHNLRVEEKGVRRLRHWAELALSVVASNGLMMAFWGWSSTSEFNALPAVVVVTLVIVGLMLTIVGNAVIYGLFAAAEAFDNDEGTYKDLRWLMNPANAE